MYKQLGLALLFVAASVLAWRLYWERSFEPRQACEQASGSRFAVYFALHRGFADEQVRIIVKDPTGREYTHDDNEDRNVKGCKASSGATPEKLRVRIEDSIARGLTLEFDTSTRTFAVLQP